MQIDVSKGIKHTFSFLWHFFWEKGEKTLYVFQSIEYVTLFRYVSLQAVLGTGADGGGDSGSALGDQRSLLLGGGGGASSPLTASKSCNNFAQLDKKIGKMEQ